MDAPRKLGNVAVAMQDMVTMERIMNAQFATAHRTALMELNALLFQTVSRAMKDRAIHRARNATLAMVLSQEVAMNAQETRGQTVCHRASQDQMIAVRVITQNHGVLHAMKTLNWMETEDAKHVEMDCSVMMD